MNSKVDAQALSWDGLLPKVETQAYSFINANPGFDGRGIIIGVIDTGVSPGVAGLKMTSDGKPKIVDVIDCSGSGDVMMSEPVQALKGQITCPDGKTIKINSEWKNPTGMYRYGSKRAFDFYPKDLVEKIKEQRKKKWLADIRELEACLRSDMISSPSNMLEEMQARITQLKNIEKEYEDFGPIHGSITFHDGENWYAVVDTTGESDDFSNIIPMADYRIARQFSQFTGITCNLSFCVNIIDNGSTLSIVVDAGAHGTHVAGILSAFHSDGSECNGIAPGAQIVSLKICDNRLGSMETGVGLYRAMIEAVKRGCHIVNMSVGEATAWDNQGKFIRLAEEIVQKYGIIFVSSAGNNGPCLTTVGTPGGTSSSIIGVGALVTQSLMLASHSLTNILDDTNYTWSSMGPASDGHLGVSIIAPGGAVSTVPEWLTTKYKFMNGTSMSSPNACGCIALLLSAAKAERLVSTPTRIRKAIENSAKMLDTVELPGQGHGLIQVEEAWKHIQDNSQDHFLDVNIAVSVLCERFDRGIYLRQPSEVMKADTFKVQVTPEFVEDTSPDVKLNYEIRVTLQSTAAWITCPEKFCLTSSPSQFNIVVDPRGLSVGYHIEFIRGYDSHNLRKGDIFEVPVTVIIPIVISAGVTSYSVIGSVGDSKILSLSHGERQRTFLVPPPGCTFIDAVIKDEREREGISVSHLDKKISEGDESNSRNNGSSVITGDVIGVHDGNQSQETDGSGRQIVLHALQLFRGTPYRDNEKMSYLMLKPSSEHVVSWAVTEGITMEFLLTRYWSTIGNTSCSVTLYFRGITVIPQEITLIHGQCVSNPIRLYSQLSNVELNPNGKFDKIITILYPKSGAKVIPLGERDILLSGALMYQLELEYDVDFTPSAGCDVTPRWPGLNGILYESEYLSQFYSIYDYKNQLVASGDAWPKAYKPNKGKHTIKFQIRHENITTLESLINLKIHLERKLKFTISLSFYKSQAQAMESTVSFRSRGMMIGTSISLFIREPTIDISYAQPGDILLGSVTYLNKGNNTVGCGTKPGGYPIRYIIGEMKPKSPTTTTTTTSNNNDSNGSSSKSEAVPDGLQTIVRDAKLKYLLTLVGNKDTFPTIYNELSTEHPDHLPVYQALLTHTTQLATQIPSISTYRTTITTCQLILSKIDEVAVAAELGINLDKDNPKAVSIRNAILTKKTALIDAYFYQTSALLSLVELLTPSPNITVEMTEKNDNNTMIDNMSSDKMIPTAVSTVLENKESLIIEIEQSFKNLMKWDDINADKYWLLVTRRHYYASRFGLALKRVNDILSKATTASVDSKSKDTSFNLEKINERNRCLRALSWEKLIVN